MSTDTGPYVYDGGVNGPQSRVVISLPPNDYTAAGEVLSCAFADDPLWLALLSDPQTRQARLARMFSALVKTTAAAHGVVETTHQLEAVAVWLPPGKELGWWPMVRSGMPMARFVMALPGRDRRSMIAVLRQLDQRRKELMPEPHWYLQAIGVEPEHQGTGFGSALVRAGISRADRDKTPIYLETETEANVAYYEHLGFGVVERTIATGLNLPIWLLTRR